MEPLARGWVWLWLGSCQIAPVGGCLGTYPEDFIVVFFEHPFLRLWELGRGTPAHNGPNLS